MRQLAVLVLVALVCLPVSARAKKLVADHYLETPDAIQVEVDGRYWTVEPLEITLSLTKPSTVVIQGYAVIQPQEAATLVGLLEVDRDEGREREVLLSVDTLGTPTRYTTLPFLRLERLDAGEHQIRFRLRSLRDDVVSVGITNARMAVLVYQ